MSSGPRPGEAPRRPTGTGTYTILTRMDGYLLGHGSDCPAAPPNHGECTCGLMLVMDAVADARTPEMEAERVAAFFDRLHRLTIDINGRVKAGGKDAAQMRNALLELQAAERLVQEQGDQ